MHTVLIEPDDTFFFRDSIPMSAGQGRGAGARLPLPSTLHEAFRASLLEKHGCTDGGLSSFRPKDAPRQGGWLGKAKSVPSKGSKDFQSLQVTGPFPWLGPDEARPVAPEGGIFFPLPLDLVFDEKNRAHVLALRNEEQKRHSAPLPALSVSPVPPKKDQPTGFLSSGAFEAYLSGTLDNLSPADVLPWDALFEKEYRIGVELDPDTNSAAKGKLYSATHARPAERFRIAAWAGLKNPVADEATKLEELDFLLLGGERRMARATHVQADLPVPASPDFSKSSEPQALRWTLATSAVFAHGWLPGWCRDSSGNGRPDGQVCLNLEKGTAHLVAACLSKPLAFAGWDVVEGQSKPTRLAVHAGSVYYFLCENNETARELATLLHWSPRSDFYGEKGFGYGFASPFPTSPDILELASRLF